MSMMRMRKMKMTMMLNMLWLCVDRRGESLVLVILTGSSNTTTKRVSPVHGVGAKNLLLRLLAQTATDVLTTALNKVPTNPQPAQPVSPVVHALL